MHLNRTNAVFSLYFYSVFQFKVRLPGLIVRSNSIIRPPIDKPGNKIHGSKIYSTLSNRTAPNHIMPIIKHTFIHFIRYILLIVMYIFLISYKYRSL